jgi:hypothetical protein
MEAIFSPKPCRWRYVAEEGPVRIQLDENRLRINYWARKGPGFIIDRMPAACSGTDVRLSPATAQPVLSRDEPRFFRLDVQMPVKCHAKGNLPRSM